MAEPRVEQWTARKRMTRFIDDREPREICYVEDQDGIIVATCDDYHRNDEQNWELAQRIALLPVLERNQPTEGHSNG